MLNDPVMTVEVTKMGNGKMHTALECWNIDYQRFGLLVTDIVRHGAKAFGVEEDQIWEWVERERLNPTTPIEAVKPN